VLISVRRTLSEHFIRHFLNKHGLLPGKTAIATPWTRADGYRERDAWFSAADVLLVKSLRIRAIEIDWLIEADLRDLGYASRLPGRLGRRAEPRPARSRSHRPGAGRLGRAGAAQDTLAVAFYQIGRVSAHHAAVA
jgi:hypothetical protein